MNYTKQNKHNVLLHYASRWSYWLPPTGPGPAEPCSLHWTESDAGQLCKHMRWCCHGRYMVEFPLIPSFTGNCVYFGTTWAADSFIAAEKYCHSRMQSCMVVSLLDHSVNMPGSMSFPETCPTCWPSWRKPSIVRGSFALSHRYFWQPKSGGRRRNFDVCQLVLLCALWFWWTLRTQSITRELLHF